MRRELGLVLVTLLLALAGLVAAASRSEDLATAGAGGEPAVVVELFTSQGCSSCPPADRLLGEIAEDPAFRGRVVALAFHVDYWNHLGWRDPFSSSAWSQRQRRYAAALGDNRVYTPQLVVDGRSHCVGSQRGEVRRQIERALARPALARLGLQVEPLADGGPLRVRVAAERVGRSAEGPLTAWVAVVEDGLSTAVGRGENGGSRLRNDRVVRLLEPAVALAPEGAEPATGQLTLALDPSWRRDRLSVVAFLQDPESLAIHAAASAPVP